MTAVPVRRPNHDITTISGMAVAVYLASVLSHEAVGHGLSTVVLGGHIERLTNVQLVSGGGGEEWRRRLIAASGPAMNVLTGIGALGLMRRTRRTDREYFLWLLGHVNLFMGAGYPLAFSFAGSGDMANILRGIEPLVAWQVSLTVAGAGLSLIAFRHALRSLDPFLGSKPERRRRAFTLTILPYLVGSVVNTMAALRNPSGAPALAAAVATSFGGTAFLAWTYLASRRSGVAEGRTVARRSLWLLLGLISLIVYFFVLGPGIPRSVDRSAHLDS
jgi:hypothetical protein